MKHGSTHIAKTYPIPPTWTAREFWRFVTFFERHQQTELVAFADALGIHYDENLRDHVPIGELVVAVIEEGGEKSEILKVAQERLSYMPEEMAN